MSISFQITPLGNIKNYNPFQTLLSNKLNCCGNGNFILFLVSHLVLVLYHKQYNWSLYTWYIQDYVQISSLHFAKDIKEILIFNFSLPWRQIINMI